MRLKTYIVDYLSEQASYKDRVLFLTCNKHSSNRDILEKYNVQEIPTSLFIKNNEQIESSSTNRPSEIKATIDRLLNSGK